MKKKDEIKTTFKSEDTEEWLDVVWTRPIGYMWALLFRRLNVHPNAVTVLSMIIGASSAYFFAHGSYWTEGVEGLWMNVAAVLLLAWANFYDSADGQLARMTGKKTRLGRILDGAASEVWFIPIYIGLVVRFYNHHGFEFRALGVAGTPAAALVATAVFFAVVLYSGFHSHSGQCGLADYYRQIHLFFLKGEKGSELDNSEEQRRAYDATPWKGNLVWKAFLKTYVGYTRKQERRTPAFQRLMAELKGKYADAGQFPEELRARFREKSLPLMKWTNVLTFNTRAIVLYLSCLLDAPWFYFFFEIVVMGCLCEWMRRRHEGFCREMLKEI